MDAGEPNGPGRKLSPVGCGCGLLVAAVLAVILGFTWYAWYQGESFEESLRDPQARAERSREILGYDELPEGYHPMGGFRVPFAMEMAMLSDRDPAPGEEIAGPAEAFRERGFVLMKTRAREERVRELDAFFSGERPDSEFFAETDLDFEVAERVGRGDLELEGDVRVRWAVERGRIALGRPEELAEGVEEAPTAAGEAPAAAGEASPAEGRDRPKGRDTFLARLMIECPAADRLRVALWFEPVPEGGGAAGTPADPRAIRRFLHHFDLCR